MFSFLSDILKKKMLDCFAPLPLEHCRIIRPYLLEREGIQNGTAILIAVPYFTAACIDPERNISAYAVSRDYHFFFAELFSEVLPLLRKAYPKHRFVGFADHSPIAECEAAARAGLGMIGENHLLITPEYSSYVFLGEIITDAEFPCTFQQISYCEGCGACKKVCPMEECGTCLSALTQKKGALNDKEITSILQYQTAWGCDLCQAVCPHTQKAIRHGTIFSPVPFFSQACIPVLTSQLLDQMSDSEFSERAYSWRKRDTIKRNLLLLENSKGETSC